MSSLLRDSKGTHNESLKIQRIFNKTSPNCETTKDQLFSKSPSQQQEEKIVLVQQYEFLELLASCLSFSCLVLAKKITLFCCQCFSKTAPEPSYPSSPLSNSLESQSPPQSSSLDFREVESYSTSLLNLDFKDSELIIDFDQGHLEFHDHDLDRFSSFNPSPPLKGCCVLSSNFSLSQSEIIPLETSLLKHLDFEDSELIADFDQDNLEFYDHDDLDRLSSFDPSPPPSKDCCVLSTNSSESQDSEIIPLETSEIFEDLNSTEELEPLFWPLEKKLSWSAGQETWDLFTMSPRKDGEASQTNFEAFEPRFEERETPGCSLGSEASRLIMEMIHRNDANSTTSVASRLGISSPNIAEFKTERNEIVQDSRLNSTSYLDSDLLEEEFKEEEISIELLLGLSEFDGHEGIDKEFNQYDFSLDDSLS